MSPWQGFALDSADRTPLHAQLERGIKAAIATGRLTVGEQLPTVRQLAVDLSINPNTVIRAYRELEIRGVLETQQGTGTFISHKKVERDDAERQRRLNQLVGEFVSRAGSAGFSVEEVLEQLQEVRVDGGRKRR